jgi:zinc/manganese transport system permease protein
MSEAIEFLLPAFMMCVVLAGIHVYLGMHVLRREVIFVDLALAQMAALGATVAKIYFAGDHAHDAMGGHIGPNNVALLSFSFAALGAVIFAFAGTVRKYISQEAVVGIVYAVSTATMMLVLSHSHDGAESMKEVLGGILLLTEWSDVKASAFVYLLVAAVLFAFRRRFHMLSWESKRARKDLKHAALWDLGFYLLFAVVLTISIQSAGVLLVFSFLIVPAVITRLFSDGILPRLMAGWAVAVLATLIGLYLSWTQEFPAGASIITVFGAVLILAGTVRYVLRSRFDT